ncbi:hypothetical protein T03_16157 [Trichinella britovi]|uniref:Uncharacterized protein n=1 Tax=Trichinella britovi TaxID=45882 RepID=A0A0V1AMG0_TRIBR|nr:hypothetical protein T03_16157 [Trichinella britovi]
MCIDLQDLDIAHRIGTVYESQECCHRRNLNSYITCL